MKTVLSPVTSVALKHPLVLQAQRASLMAHGNGADEFISQYPLDAVLPGILQTTSTAREDWISWYMTEQFPDHLDMTTLLWEALSCAEKSGVLTESMEKWLLDTIWELEADTVKDIDFVAYPSALVPTHSCHSSVIYTATLCSVMYPEADIELCTNEFHSTIAYTLPNEAAQYFDLLVGPDPRAHKGFLERGGEYVRHPLTDIPLGARALHVLETIFGTAAQGVAA